MNKPTAPCKTCEKREVGCHTNCDGFAKYEKDRKEWVALVKKNKEETNKVKIGRWYK